METRDPSTESPPPLPGGDKQQLAQAQAANGVNVQQQQAAAFGDDGTSQNPASSPVPSSGGYGVKPDPDHHHLAASPVSASSSSVGVGVDQAHAHSQAHLSHAMVGHSQQQQPQMNSVDGSGMMVPGGPGGGDPQQQHPPPPGTAVANGMVDAGTQAATQWGATPMGFGDMGDGVPPPPPPSSMPPSPGGVAGANAAVGTDGGPAIMGPGAENPYMQMHMQQMQQDVGGPAAPMTMGDPAANGGGWSSYHDTLNLAPPPNSKQVQRISRGCGTALSNTMVLPTSRKKPNIVKSHLISEPEVLIVYVPENRPTPTLDDVARRSRSTDTRMDDFGIAYDYHGEITDVNALTIPQSSFSKAPSSMSNDPPVTIPTSAQWQPPPSQQQQQQQSSASQVRTPPRSFHDEPDVKIDAQGRRLTQRCDICDKWFANTGTLHNHKLRHEGVRRFPCPHCGMAFIFRSGLSRHLRTHSTEKKWQCPDCNKSFREKSNLKIHRRIHTGEKPFKCRFCGRGFTQAAGLKCHENSKIHVWDRQIDFRKFTNVDVNNPPAVGVANEGWNNNRVSNTLANMPRMRKIPPPPPPLAPPGVGGPMGGPHHTDPHTGMPMVPYGAPAGMGHVPPAPGAYGMPPGPPGQQYGAPFGAIPGQAMPGTPQFGMGPMDPNAGMSPGAGGVPPPPPGMDMTPMPGGDMMPMPSGGHGTDPMPGQFAPPGPMPVPGSVQPGGQFAPLPGVVADHSQQQQPPPGAAYMSAPQQATDGQSVSIGVGGDGAAAVSALA